jgi:hypothetical protein
LQQEMNVDVLAVRFKYSSVGRLCTCLRDDGKNIVPVNLVLAGRQLG